MTPDTMHAGGSAGLAAGDLADGMAGLCLDDAGRIRLPKRRAI